ncbi:MAG: response regulator transcription factor [Clostridia bacterium]|nr:response regulator transcription factor [Clostridia bacterium]
MEYRVVIADDSAQDILCIRSIIESLSFSMEVVLQTAKTETALHFLQMTGAELLILNVELFGAAKCLEAAARLKRRPQVILLGNGFDIANGHPMTARCRVQKPISSMRMINALHSALQALKRSSEE